MIINEIESYTFDTLDVKGVTNSISFYDEILEIEENNNEISSEVSTENYFQETTNKIIFWPLSLDINDANPVARPALGSLLMLYISRNKGYCLVAK